MSEDMEVLGASGEEAGKEAGAAKLAGHAAGAMGRSLDPEEVFKEFFADNQEKYKDHKPGMRSRLSERSGELYGAFWRSYNRFLMAKRDGKQWHEASSQDVDAFLSTVKGRKKRDKQEGQHSGVTRQRYETVLNRVYAFALGVKQLEPAAYANLAVNPVHMTNLEKYDGRENAGSFVMQPDYRRRLLNAIEMKAQGTEARDAAMLALMTEIGLTPAELIALKCADVQWEDDQSPDIGWMEHPERQPDLKEPSIIHVRQCSKLPRLKQERHLRLGQYSKKALRQWLEWRGPYVRRGFEDVLMCGQRGRVGNTLIYLIAKEHVEKTLTRWNGDVAPVEKQLLHMGPMALRNTAIMNWVDNIEDVGMVLDLAGIQFPKSLSRFVEHARNPQVRDRLLRAIKVQIEGEQKAARQKTEADAGQEEAEPSVDG